MKCPKCLYLGFETGDRCRHCGYDFSLLALAEPAQDLPLTFEPPASDLSPADVPDEPGIVGAEPVVTMASTTDDAIASLPAPTPDFDLPLRSELAEPVALPVAVPASTAIKAPSASPVRKLRVAAPARENTPDGLPLFAPDANPSDPLILRLAPTAPRAPVAVRRSTEVSRFQSTLSTRTVPEPPGAIEPDAASVPGGGLESAVRPRRRALALETSTAGRRVVAAALDLAILGSIDLAVLYFTLRMADLPMEQWRALPGVPLVAFIALLAFGYYASLTAVGGQTIGKMATGIKVVADDGLSMQPVRVCQRTLVAAASLATLGAAYAPALFGVGGRALHDRVAHTRVVAVPNA